MNNYTLICNNIHIVILENNFFLYTFCNNIDIAILGDKMFQKTKK